MNKIKVMSTPRNTRASYLLIVLTLFAVRTLATAQVPQNPTPSPQDDVVRLYTQLVQTDVMVFEKDGSFRNGLKREDFQLKVDGEIQPIQAFDLIRAGSNEELQLAAARGSALKTDPNSPNRPVPLDRGRTVLFFLDDIHMDLGGLKSAQSTISHFLEHQMGQNDQAAIITATGQPGFLQQLTDNRNVLEQALNQIKVRSYTVGSSERPQMSEYDALLITADAKGTLESFVVETMRLNPGMSRGIAESVVRGRANGIMSQAGALNQKTLGSLEHWIGSTSDLPGRKIFFFMSNGFLIDFRRSDTRSWFETISSTAAKSGVVIYSIDTRGLVVPDSQYSGDKPYDRTNQSRGAHGEILAMQDGLNALARDTGGQPIFNTNDFKPGVDKAIKESSVYYLLAWKPESDAQAGGRFRTIEVTIPDHPDLIVRLRRGFADTKAPATAATPAKTELRDENAAFAKLRESIAAPYPKTEGLPIGLTTFYYDVAGKGATVSSSVHIPGELMTFQPQVDKMEAIVDVTGAVFNTKGTAEASFRERIVTTAADANAAMSYRAEISYTFPASVKPGLYQVRVAARDLGSGRAGAAHAWIEVPDLANKRLAISSLVLSARKQAKETDEWHPSRRFRRGTSLRLLLFAYNTRTSATDGKPDAAVQIQVVRDNQPVITTELRKMNTDTASDPARIPYAAELPLNALSPGLYVLQVSIIDRVSKESFTQQARFEVY